MPELQLCHFRATLCTVLVAFISISSHCLSRCLFKEFAVIDVEIGILLHFFVLSVCTSRFLALPLYSY